MFRIKKLDIFIAKQFGTLFFGAFFISLFVLMMQFLWKYVDTLIGKGLSLDILAQFFWYMALMLVPQALPLAILLSSLISYGNLGESSELTAIKAAGTSLLQSFRSLIFITILVTIASFYFQNNIGPDANRRLAQLLVSMKQKSPELEIPEGVFYDGIPQSNLYVEKKDLETGKLYGIMIYRMTNSFEDAAIILADSGMLQSTAEKKHLVLNLWSGEWFENMRQQEVAGSASVPYRRETFSHKNIVLDFDGDFNMMDAGAFSNNARTKSIDQIVHDLDSLNHVYDSIGQVYLKDTKMALRLDKKLSPQQLKSAKKLASTSVANPDTAFARLTSDQKLNTINQALASVQQNTSDLEFKSLITSDGDKLIRQHKIEVINKYLLALSCLIFFFIGAPLGAIIRKGGLGIPIIVSVLVFIIYYILQNTGYRMARGGMWTIWFGESLAPAVLVPLACWVTYKANNDSTVFNFDIWREVIMRILGLRLHRNVAGKEVIITDPDYQRDAQQLAHITEEVAGYAKAHNLRTPPNVVSVFFRYQPDHVIEDISEEMETVIEDLGNTRDKIILNELNNYPILSVKAHTRPFERKWMNVVSAIILPLGIFFYCRMWRFRLRLWRDLNTITESNRAIIERINSHFSGIETPESNIHTDDSNNSIPSVASPRQI